jgi:hypothetical protein
LIHKHINHVPRGAAWLGTLQISIVTAITVYGCWNTPLNAVNVTGSIILGAYATWATLGVAKDVKTTTHEAESSGWMTSWKLIEQR